jgi:hypothetical protein
MGFARLAWPRYAFANLGHPDGLVADEGFLRGWFLDGLGYQDD